jgi:predicted CopG family antitoxin
MATKTITLDLEAYELLSRQKKSGQSFSQVIKEHFGRTRKSRDLLDAVAHTDFAEETLDRLDRLVAARAEETAREVRL